jgi:hypothetical protein
VNATKTRRTRKQATNVQIEAAKIAALHNIAMKADNSGVSDMIDKQGYNIASAVDDLSRAQSKSSEKIADAINDLFFADDERIAQIGWLLADGFMLRTAGKCWDGSPMNQEATNV